MLYYSRYFRKRAGGLFADLREWEDQQEFPGADTETQADSLASQATVWASLREFKRAHRCLERAHELSPDDSWVLSCESGVFGSEDRWQEALASAERGWQIRPGTPYGAGSLGHSLLNLRRLSEATHRISAAAEDGESFEVVNMACWFLCALAESSVGDERRQLLGRAKEYFERFPGLAPLADRDTRAMFARVRLDIAELEDDHEAMERFAAEARSPFHQTILKNLRKNPLGRRIRLPFRRAIQKYEACLPTSVASALGAMEIPLDPDAMAAELTFGGTAEWAAAEWLEKRGLAVRFFAATPETAGKLIENGIAFVVTLEADASAHAVAVVGIDQAAGTLIIHDPQALRTTEYLLEYFGKGEAPLGPKGMVMVPKEKAGLLDQLLPQADVEAMTATEAHQRAILQQGPAEGERIVEALKKKQPSHPATRLLEAMQALDEGRVGTALSAFQELFKGYPNSAFVRARILSSCRLMGNTALMRDTLASVVERGMLPGIQSQQKWFYPPGEYVSEFAFLLAESKDGRNRARALLQEAIARNSACAAAWHALGDLLWEEQDKAGASLAYRIASCLAASNEHYARAYCNALGNCGREEEGLAWLEERARKFGGSSFGVVTWVTWIAALEDWGHPERALAASEEAVGNHADSSDLLWFVVPLVARMGQWDKAENLLKRLEGGKNRALYHQAATNFYRMRGELDSAIEHAGKWVSEAPYYMYARRELLNLLAKRDSAAPACQRSSQWLLEHPGHDEIEQMHCDMLDQVSSEEGGKKYRLLLRRLKRNPEDAWAWREVVFFCISEYRQTEGARQKRLMRRIDRFLSQCERTAPDSAATLRARAEWYEARGEWTQALSNWLESISREPGAGYGPHKILELLVRFGAQERQAAWKRIEELVPTHRGRLAAARDIAMRAGRQLSVATAEQTLASWKKLRPDDPELIEAAADLLLEHGQGRTDAQRALEELASAVQHFPYHAGLRFSLADAFRRLGRFKEAQEVFVEIVRRQPDNSAARIELAKVRQRDGQVEEALRELEIAARGDPQNTIIWNARAQILLRAGRVAEARATIDEGLRRFPWSVHWLEAALSLLTECGDPESAVRAAREGVRLFPRGAYLWFLLGRLLQEHRQYAATGEVEACLRRSVVLNRTLFVAADYLAMELVEQRRYAEAEQVMMQIAERLADPSPARGRVAWIHRQEGKRSEARQEMAALVREAPWYLWGWRVLMEWLTEDQTRDETLAVLSAIPPELSTNQQFRRQRLQTLERAKIADTERDAEWSSLLHDFPEDVSLHLHRYDSLRDAKRLPEAEAVLRAVLPVDPQSPFVLARLAEVLARDQQKKDQTIQAVLDIFFCGTEESNWPANFAWSVAKKAQYEEAVYAKARERMGEGKMPTITALSLLGAHAMRRGGAEKRPLQPLWRSLFPDRGAKELLSLLSLADASSEATGAHRAGFLRLLNNAGYNQLVVRHWKEHREAVERDVETWAETARSLVGLKKDDSVRNLLAGWRERAGVPMWSIGNYVMSISGLNKKNLREVHAACRDALAGLQHDHCAKYLAHRQAESAALLGDQKALLDVWKEQRSYFDAKVKENEWFEARRKDLLLDIPMMARALEGNDVRTFKKMRRSLRWKEFSFGMPRLNVPSSSDAKINYRWGWLLFWILWLLARAFTNH